MIASVALAGIAEFYYRLYSHADYITAKPNATVLSDSMKLGVLRSANELNAILIGGPKLLLVSGRCCMDCRCCESCRVDGEPVIHWQSAQGVAGRRSASGPTRRCCLRLCVLAMLGRFGTTINDEDAARLHQHAHAA